MDVEHSYSQSIIGFVRYSCLATFRGNKFPDFFKPEYLDYRLDIFRNVTLKSFQEQSDKDFHVFLLHSEDLPLKYKDIFRSLEDENSFLHNVYISDFDIIEGKFEDKIISKSIEYVKFINDVSINFRIDNDDALPFDYISRLRFYLKHEFKEHVISIPKVLFIQRVKEHKFLVKERYLPSHSAGLAYITDKNNYKTIMSLGEHHKVNLKHPLILLPGAGSIFTINGRNVANNISFGGTVLNINELKTFLIDNNLSDIDFNCLHICKRTILKLLIKIVNWVKKALT